MLDLLLDLLGYRDVADRDIPDRFDVEVEGRAVHILARDEILSLLAGMFGRAPVPD